MAQRLLITFKKNICEHDVIYNCIYTPTSDVGDLLKDWLRYNGVTGAHVGPLKIIIRDWGFFDKFQDDFRRIKEFCPRVSSFNDVWTIQDLADKKIIHTSDKEDKAVKYLIGGIITNLDDFGDNFTSTDAKN